MTSTVEEMVKDSFSSRDALRAQLVDTASAMFGPGFVWLVKRRDDAFRKGKSLAVLATYNAGSPLHEAHYRRQSIDMNTLPGTSLADVSGDLLRRQTEVQNSPGAFGYQQDKKPPSLLELQPLLCVNTWEHVWLPDWGVAGKDAYLDAWWARINWQAVDAVINADHSANRGRGWRNNYHWSRPAPE